LGETVADADILDEVGVDLGVFADGLNSVRGELRCNGYGDAWRLLTVRREIRRLSTVVSLKPPLRALVSGVRARYVMT
jgi:hypothetical protein